jgi:hypothetical protein
LDKYSITQIAIDYARPIIGTTKVTYPGKLGSRRVAVKLFMDYEEGSGEPLDSDTLSQLEFDAYLKTYNSVVRPYIPEPLGVISNESHDKLLGLIVEWKASKVLSSLYGRVKVPQQHLADFQANLLKLPDDRLLDSDSLDEGNIGWNAKGLWLAEPRIETYLSPDAWISVVGRQITYLMQNYT